MPLMPEARLTITKPGANHRRSSSCEVWQTDVTSFGRQKYVHVSVDTFSGAVYASAHTEEKSSNASKHLIQAFSFLGIPKVLKTDNGPTYTSKEFRGFLQQWGIEHKKGIPYSLNPPEHQKGSQPTTTGSKGRATFNSAVKDPIYYQFFQLHLQKPQPTNCASLPRKLPDAPESQTTCISQGSRDMGDQGSV